MNSVIAMFEHETFTVKGLADNLAKLVNLAQQQTFSDADAKALRSYIKKMQKTWNAHQWPLIRGETDPYEMPTSSNVDDALSRLLNLL